MEQVCPGLPDWNALNKPECIQALATPETSPNGRLLDYPADWGSRAATIIKPTTTCSYTAVPAGSEGALVAELEASEAAKTPLVMMFWGPHYALAEVDVGWVEDAALQGQTNDHCITAARCRQDRLVGLRAPNGRRPTPSSRQFKVDADRAAEDDAGRRQEGRGSRRGDQGLDRQATRRSGSLGSTPPRR